MSPVPDLNPEDIIGSSVTNAPELNDISSEDELDQTMYNEPPISTEDPPRITTSSAPSTPTGERDPPVIFRKPSTIITRPPIDVRYQGIGNSNDNNGLLGTFFGCFKPFFSAVYKVSETIRYITDLSIKSDGDWEIPVDKIINGLELIGRGIEGSVFRGTLDGEDVACKRVKSKEETNIKHLKKLNHLNVIKFRGISIAPPLYYIVMEHCAYGSLYDLLKRRREMSSCTKPSQVLDWSKQISNGVEYLHSNKIVHRDLKSPNILFFDENTLKISDFGTSKELINRRSQIMSFIGTSAWMAPEVIRQEPCSEKIDVWSFGIVLWEILTCAVPYDNIDPTAVMWGVGKGSLKLLIPTSVPEGFKLLMTMCWNRRPIDRPSFLEILKHLEINKHEIILFEEEQEYARLTRQWSMEINEHQSNIPVTDLSLTLQLTNEELMRKRREELEHIADIRAHCEKRVQQVNSLYMELKSLVMQLEERECVIREKERSMNIKGKKRTMNSIYEVRRKSLEILKAATQNLNDPIRLLTHKKRSTNNQNSPRRKRSSGHHRNNSKGSANAWTPPSLTEIEDQEKRRVSIDITPNTIEPPLPTISGMIDARSETNNQCQFKPNELELKNPIHSSVISSPSRTSSNEIQPQPFSRQRRRRNNPKSNSPSAITRPHKHANYSSSEEGEVEETHSDSYILDDEQHRAKHDQSHGNFSSESEIYNEKYSRGLFSDEDGHVSDDRPESRESTFNSEPEHE